MKVYFLSIFSLFFLNCSAQKYFVSTDYNNCTTGVKDSLGNWVVQPIYDYVEESFPGTFIVSAGTKEGVVNKTGKILIPVMYDAVESHTVDEMSESVSLPASYLFIVTVGKK